MSTRVELIVGLGNPGPDYAQTRHNVGFWFVEALAERQGLTFRHEGKFQGEVCKAGLDGYSFWLLKPQTYMNRSGAAVAALAQYYKIPVDHILVVHDELDLPPGTVRYKEGGGHAGHNGLRSTISSLGLNTFSRLRIGIGRPGEKSQVTGYVLKHPNREDRDAIEKAIDETLDTLPVLLAGDPAQFMNRLHSR